MTAHTRPVSLHGWPPVRHKNAFTTSNTLENAASDSLNVIGLNNPIESDTIKAWGFVREHKVLLGDECHCGGRF